MTEKRFYVKYEVDEGIRYWEIIDNKSQNSTSNEIEIVELLNELDEQWIGELNLRETFLLELQRVEKENEQLKQFKQNVFSLIDKNLEKDKEDYEMTYEDYLNGRIEVLEELKKELSDD